jgi:N-acetylmuramoyl-L-alanine amidase
MNNMKQILFTFFLLGVISVASLSQPRIDVVYPREGDKIGPVANSFLIGSVTPGSELTVNGQRVEVYQNGAFLAFIPFQPGEFTIKLVAEKNGRVDSLIRTVNVAPRQIMIGTDSLAIVHSTIVPAQEKGVRSGDRVWVSFRGTPGRKASFSIGRGQGVAMVEQVGRPESNEKAEAFSDSTAKDTLTLPGTYTGSYPVSGREDWYQSRIYCYLVDSLGMMAVDSSQGLVTSWPESTQVLGESVDSVTVLKTGAELGYELFIPKGVKMQLTGSDGDHYRLRLSDNKDAWVKKASVKMLPAGSGMGNAKLSVVRVTRSQRGSEVRLMMSRPCVYRAAPAPDGMSLVVTVYGAQADMDWVRFEAQQELVRDVRWKQLQNGVSELEIMLSQSLWGFSQGYEENSLVFEVRPRPRISKSKPLAGVKVAIDPGHSPENGAVGPLRTLEKDVNWQISQRLGNLLKKAGARVYYTREGDQSVGIYQRPSKAAGWGADMLVSVHNNASPDGVNPLNDSGYSTYYYQPFSRDLAFEVHQQFRETLPLPDHGFYYGNLVLCRSTEMPSFLVEPTFIIVPKEEALVRSSEFQEKIARALFLGIKNYLAGMAGK